MTSRTRGDAVTINLCACGHRPTLVEYKDLGAAKVYFVICHRCLAAGPDTARAGETISCWNSGERVKLAAGRDWLKEVTR